MRAAFVLATILCLALPQLSWGAIDTSSAGTGSMSLGSPAAVATQIVRAIAKTDKTFSFGGAIAADATGLLLPAGLFSYTCAAPAEPPNVNLEGPPLAPRPPPLA